MAPVNFVHIFPSARSILWADRGKRLLVVSILYNSFRISIVATMIQSSNTTLRLEIEWEKCQKCVFLRCSCAAERRRQWQTSFSEHDNWCLHIEWAMIKLSRAKIVIALISNAEKWLTIYHVHEIYHAREEIKTDFTIQSLKFDVLFNF